MARTAVNGRSRRRAWLVTACIVVLGALAVAFALLVHPFLAITLPVEADILVIEGWVPDYVVDQAAVEAARGKYRHVFVSGMANGDGTQSEVAAVVRHLAEHLKEAGVDPAIIISAPAAKTNWNRTSSMARAVRDRMRALPARPRGVNVLTLGPHARQSRLAYSRMLGPDVPVGVISIPKDDYDPDRWWASSAGVKKTTKDFAGWARELAFGLRE